MSARARDRREPHVCMYNPFKKYLGQLAIQSIFKLSIFQACCARSSARVILCYCTKLQQGAHAKCLPGHVTHMITAASGAEHASVLWRPGHSVTDPHSTVYVSLED